MFAQRVVRADLDHVPLSRPTDFAPGLSNSSLPILPLLVIVKTRRVSNNFSKQWFHMEQWYQFLLEFRWDNGGNFIHGPSSHPIWLKGT